KNYDPATFHWYCFVGMVLLGLAISIIFSADWKLFTMNNIKLKAFLVACVIVLLGSFILRTWQHAGIFSNSMKLVLVGTVVIALVRILGSVKNRRHMRE
ncbi:hypothetical protein, partial [Lacticaseibacillus paracasei]